MREYQNYTPQQLLQIKQRYLRTNIIDSGHDPQQFISFCVKNYGQIDLVQWELQKLSNVVQQFISKFQDEKSQRAKQQSQNKLEQWNDNQESGAIIEPNQNINQKSEPIKQIVFSDADWDIFIAGGNNLTKNNQKMPKNIQSLKIEKISEQKQESIIKKQTKQYLKSTIQKQSPLMTQKPSEIKSFPQIKKQSNKKQISQKIQFEAYAHKSIKIDVGKMKQLTPLPQITDISILKTQQINKNFFQGDYTVYHILIRPCQHSFIRKFNDFRRLRTLLTKFYPTMKFPYIEPEGWLTHSSQGKDQQMLSKYKWMIIQFLRFILMKNEQLKNNNLVREFIGLGKKTQQKDKQYLKKVFDEFNHAAKPKSIGQIKLINNTFLIKANPLYTKQINSHMLILPQIDILYEKLKRQLETVHYNYDLLSKSFNELSCTFDSLQTLVNKHLVENYSKQMKIYEKFKEVCAKLQNNLNDHNFMFKAKIGNMFKYEKENMYTIKDVVDIRNKINYQFNRQNCPDSPLILSQSDILQWQSNISLEQPCKVAKNTLSIQNSFWQHVCAQQIIKYWQSLRMKINEQISLIAYDQLDMQNDNLNFWNTLIKKCVL